MSNVIEFLEKMGQDASLRHASRDQILAAMMSANIDADLHAPILNADAERLENALGVQPNVCAIIFPVETGDTGSERSGEYLRR
jgi:hypothetical protein